MLDTLRLWLYRFDQWSKNYEYTIEGFSDKKIITSFKYNSISVTTIIVSVVLLFIFFEFLPEEIGDVALFFLIPGFLFVDFLPEFIVFLTGPIAVYFYTILINFFLNKCDLDLFKKIGWKSNLGFLFGFTIAFIFGLLISFFFGETKIFNIDIFYIILPIFLFVLFFIENLLSPNLITVWFELVRQLDLKLISKEKFLSTRKIFIEQIENSGLSEEDAKVIKENILSLKI